MDFISIIIVVSVICILLSNISITIRSGNGKLSINSNDDDDVASRTTELTAFTTLPLSTEVIIISNDLATVKIEQCAGLEAIELEANQPSNWTITGGTIKHTPPWAGHLNTSIAIINGVFRVNGKAQTWDTLVIKVPNSYKGKLSASNTGIGTMAIGNLSIGSLKLRCSGTGNITGANLDLLSEFDSKSSSIGAVSFNDIQAQSCRISTSGTGNFSCDKAKGDTICAKTSSIGTIKVKEATADDVDLSASGTGSIELKYLEARLLKAETSSIGDIDVKNGSVTTGTAKCSGSGDITLRGKIGDIKQSKTSLGNIRITKGENNDH